MYASEGSSSSRDVVASVCADVDSALFACQGKTFPRFRNLGLFKLLAQFTGRLCTMNQASSKTRGGMSACAERWAELVSELYGRIRILEELKRYEGGEL